MTIEKMRVLVCDDSIFVRKKMVDTLKKAGVSEVYEAQDGGAAVEAYKRDLPDLTFMDIVMPVKSGVEALREILHINPAAKVVIASSVGTQSNLKEAIEAGAYNFLQKPIADDQLLKILTNLTK